jgi:O-antigen ligase
MRVKQSSKTKWLFLTGLVLSTIIVTPLTSFDPFNSAKLIVVTSLSMCLAGYLLVKVNLLQIYKFYKVETILISGFFIQSILVLFTSPTASTLQLFGIDGRNTGFIFYISLLILFISTLAIIDKNLTKYLIFTLIFVGLLNALYGSIQFFNLDPFNWSNPYNRVFGFFGNPNFQSAFMGITSAGLWALIFKPALKNTLRVFIGLSLILTLSIIIVSDSIQGIIIYALGLIIALYFQILNRARFKKFLLYFTLITIAAFIVMVLDILQRTPWSSFLYKDSVSNRGDLWRAAWRMAVDNPIFGVGFDGYEYFYRQYRDSISIIERGEATTSNSAHNVFLDILTSGGFPLLILYILLIGLVIKSLIKAQRKLNSYDPIFTALAGSWICYQVQSLISINQIGIALWGWVLGAAIIAYEKSLSNDFSAGTFQKTVKTGVASVVQSVGVILGIIISIPPYLVDTNFRAAIDSRKIDLVLNSAYKWPQSPQRMYQVAAIFKQNEILDTSESVAMDCVAKFPRSYDSWQLLSTLSTLSMDDRNKAIEKMKELDPNNPNIK